MRLKASRRELAGTLKKHVVRREVKKSRRGGKEGGAQDAKRVADIWLLVYMFNFLLREHLLRERGFVETELAISHTHRVSLTHTGSRTGWSRSNWWGRGSHTLGDGGAPVARERHQLAKAQEDVLFVQPHQMDDGEEGGEDGQIEPGSWHICLFPPKKPD